MEIKIKGSLYPVHILEPGAELPEKGTFYVFAQNGIYLVKDTGLIRATVKVPSMAILDPLDIKASLTMPKIPATIIAQALLFFRRVYERYKSEAAVLLYYSSKDNLYQLDVFDQTVTGASVDYAVEGKFGDTGYQLVGTIHSHCDFSAFHSGTDIHDEKNFDGIHITIGHVHQPYFTISCSAVVNNNRFLLKPEDSIIGVKEVEYSKPSVFAGYRRPLGVPREESKGIYGIQEESGVLNFLFGAPPAYDYTTPAKKEQYYDLVLPDEKDYRSCPFPREWLEKVGMRSYYRGPMLDGYPPLQVQSFCIGGGKS